MKTLPYGGIRIAMGIVSIIALAAGCVLSAKPASIQQNSDSGPEPAVVVLQSPEALAQSSGGADESWNSFLTTTTDAGPMFPGVWAYGEQTQPDAEQVEQSQAYAHYMVARLESSQGDYESAAKLLKKAEDLRPGDLQIPLAIARTELEARNFVRAIEAAEELVERRPDSFEAHLALAQANEALADDSKMNKHSEQALEHYEICREMRPRNLRALEPLGYLYFARLQRLVRSPDRNQAAKKVIDIYQAIFEVSRGRRKITPLHIMASVNRIQGDHAEAERQYRAMIEIDPHDLRPYMQLARLYKDQGETDRALNAYRDALIVDTSNENIQSALDEILLPNPSDSPDRLLDFYRQFARDYRSNTDIRKLYAFRLIIHGRDREALRAYREIAKRDRGDLGSRMALAHLLIKAGQFEDTRSTLKEIEKMKGDDAILLANLADFYTQAMMPKEAERLYLKAIGLAEGGDKIRILKQVKMFYLRSENYESALGALTTALDGLEGDKRYELQIERAGVLELMDRSTEAEEIYRELISSKPDYSNAYFNLNDLYVGQENFDEAIVILDEALNYLDADERSAARVQKANILLELKRYDDAAETYQELIDEDPEKPLAYLLLGQLYDETDQLEQAEKAYRKITVIDKGNWDAYNNLGYMWATRGIRLEEAKAMIEKALSLRPGAGYIRDSLGWVLYQQGEYEEAVVELEAAARQLQGTPSDPGNAEIFEHLGDVYSKMGRDGDARKAYEKAVESDPESQSAKDKLGGSAP